MRRRRARSSACSRIADGEALKPNQLEKLAEAGDAQHRLAELLALRAREPQAEALATEAEERPIGSNGSPVGQDTQHQAQREPLDTWEPGWLQLARPGCHTSGGLSGSNPLPRPPTGVSDVEDGGPGTPLEGAAAARELTMLRGTIALGPAFGQPAWECGERGTPNFVGDWRCRLCWRSPGVQGSAAAAPGPRGEGA